MPPSLRLFASLLVTVPVGIRAAPALEEIIVTAEKRAESIQDVPISIAAFSEDALERLGVYDLKHLAAKVPNLVINEFTGSPTTVRLFIRGIGQGDVQVTQDPSVALYMDGVYIGSSVGTAFETADIARIEVLRGPQGTLYGRNATGGAINLITYQADPSEFSVRQLLTAGNLDIFRSRSIVNVPLSDDTAVKFGYSTSQREGWVDNLGNGTDWGEEDRTNFTGDFHWEITAQQQLDYKYEYSRIRDTARLSQVLEFNPAAPGASAIQFTNPAVNASGQPVEVSMSRLEDATSYDLQERGDVKIRAHTLSYAWDINDRLSLRSITGYRDLDAFSQMAQTPTTSLFGLYSVTNGLPETDFNQFSQELQLLGDANQWTWVAGLYYYEDESEESNLGDANGSEAIPPGELVDFTSTENTSIAAFGQATWTPSTLDNRWHFTLGARYSDDNRKAFRDNNRVSFGFAGAPTNTPAFTENYNKDFDKFNPSAVIEYDVSDFISVYAKYITAYKSGGTSQRSTSSQNFQAGFDEEDVTSYELGYKGDAMEGRLRLNAALFYMEFDGYQQSVQTGTSPGERDFVNIDTADITGVELDLSLALTEELTGSFNYGYLDTSFGPSTISYLRIDQNSPSGLVVVTEGLTDDLALAPEHSATGTLDYLHGLDFATLSASVSVQWQDQSLSGIQEPVGVLDSRTLLSATLGLSEIALGDSYGTLRVMLWGNNLLDQDYYIGNIRQGAFDSLGLIGLATFGDPRTYGLTIEYDYR
ncbi:MAG: TonB-dependent receptor [Pseudomonadota bacterium]